MANATISRELAEKIAQIAAHTAVEAYKKEKKKEVKDCFDRRLRDTKFLLRNYLRIKEHIQDAIASLSEISDEDFAFFEGLVDDDEQIDVASIVVSKGKSAIMLAHIDAMLRAYRKLCESSQHNEHMRRYRVLESMCLIEPCSTVDQIAERECMDRRNVYKDFNMACEKMSALLFGVQWIDID